jgi:hypothetical protein
MITDEPSLILMHGLENILMYDCCYTKPMCQSVTYLYSYHTIHQCVT